MCRTRWAARHTAYQHFYQAYIYIITALENIVYGVNKELVGDEFQNCQWDTKSTGDASSLLNSLSTFDFVITFITLYELLSHLSGVTVKLQSSTMDIITAFEEIKDVKATYLNIAENMDEVFHKTFAHAVRMADKLNVQPSMPRVVQKQIHRNNAPSISPEDYYRKNLAVPFVGHIMTELEAQFSSLAVISSKLLSLVPSVTCSVETPNINEAVEIYREDLPSPNLLPQEWLRWKVRYSSKPTDSIPNTVAKALKDCDETSFPNIYTLLKIIGTIPATSCECERSASALRRLHTYNRASMNQERLSSLAMIHIHYTKEVNLEEVVDIFAKKHPRRLELNTLLRDY